MTKQQYAQDNFFSSWVDLSRCTRREPLLNARKVLDNTLPEMRVKAFQGIAGGLSGSESAYLIWSYNLMSDDPTRPQSLTCAESCSTTENNHVTIDKPVATNDEPWVFNTGFTGQSRQTFA